MKALLLGSAWATTLRRVGYAAALGAAIFIAIAAGWALRTGTSGAARAFAAMDRTHPGRGADLSRDAVQDHPMAYALYASAAVDLGEEGAANSAADWLVENAEKSGGWGLKFAWDAFSDGSVNPSEASYGIETALAVRALLDVYERSGEQRHATAALRALDHYAKRFTQTDEGGFFWYSDQASDAVQVTNVSAMLAGEYARSASLFGREDHRALASAAVRQLMGERKNGGFWAYGATRPSANDALHAAYVVIGLAQFSRYSGQAIDLAAEAYYLRRFVTKAGVSETIDGDKSARAGGVAQIVYALAEVGQLEAAESIAGWLRAYEGGGGHFCYHPGHACKMPRVQGQVVSGLARLERRRSKAQPHAWERLVASAEFSPRDSARGFEFDRHLWLSNGYYHGHVALRDLWRSADGVSWRLVNNSTPYDSYSGMAVFAGHIWAANRSVWRSRDGVTWEQVLIEAPFADHVRNAQARLLVFKGRLWFLGFGNVWSSADGAIWERMSAPAFGERGGYSALVWRDRIWVLGGFKPAGSKPPEIGYPDRTSLNDVWASSDGKEWRLIADNAAWSRRVWHAAIVHGTSLYVIGGYSGSNNANLSDVWMSDDGRRWQRVEAGHGISPRHFPTVFSRSSGILVVAGNAWPVTSDIWRLRVPGP